MVAYRDRLNYSSTPAFCVSWMSLVEREYPSLDEKKAARLITIFRENQPFLREAAYQDFELALEGGHLHLAALHYFVWKTDQSAFTKISIVGWTAIRPHDHIYHDALSYILHFEPAFLAEERRALVRRSLGFWTYPSWDSYAEEIRFLISRSNIQDNRAPIWRDFVQSALDYHHIDDLFARVISTLRWLWFEFKEEFISAVEGKSDLPPGCALIRQLVPLVHEEPRIVLKPLFEAAADLKWERRGPAVRLWQQYHA